MTLRHRLRVIAISSTLVACGLAAAPVAAATVIAAPPVIRNDALGGVAAHALVDLQTYLASSDTSARIAYDGERHEIAGVVANRLAVDPVALELAWRSADSSHQQALMAALSQLGVPYHRNSSKPGVGFDCSGLTAYAWSQAGVNIPHQSASQIRTMASRTADTAQAGDIVYYPGHAMMYLGIGGAIVHAPYTGRTVEVDFVSTLRHRSIRYGDPLG
jgi:cell wall-associated NlpC family hydrolase